MVHEVDPRELFSRYEGNPIIKASAFPRMVNAAFNPAAVMFEGQTLLLMRVEDRSGLSRLVVATSDDGFTDWEVDDEPGDRAGSRLLRGAVGRRGSPDHARRRRGISHRLHGLLTRRTARVPRDHDRLPNVQEARGDPVSRGQGRGAPPAEVRRSMGPDPPTGIPRRRTRRAHLALLEPRPASLGGLADPASRSQGRVVGRRQDRARAAAAPHRSGVARLLSRRARDGVRLDLPARIGAPRPGRSHRGDRPGERVGLRTPHDLRTIGRRPRRRVPVRLDPRRGRRHGADVLRGRGQRRLRRDRQRPRPPRAPVEPPGGQGVGGADGSTSRPSERSRARLPWPPAGTASLERE